MARIVEVGHDLEIVRFGEVALTNTGKLACGRLSLYLDDDHIYQSIERRTREALFTPSKAKSDASQSRSALVDKEKATSPQKTLVGEQAGVDLSMGLFEDDAILDLERVLSGTSRERIRDRSGRFQTPRGNVLTGTWWNLSLRPNLQLRLPDSTSCLESSIANAELVLDIGLFPGETRQLWGVLSLKVCTSPRDKDLVTASIDLEIIRW
jgi:hypothetical protein